MRSAFSDYRRAHSRLGQLEEQEGDLSQDGGEEEGEGRLQQRQEEAAV